MKKQAQLKLIDRTKLQAYLEDEIPVKVICKRLDVSKQTIYREIHRNVNTLFSSNVKELLDFLLYVINVPKEVNVLFLEDIIMLTRLKQNMKNN